MTDNERFAELIKSLIERRIIRNQQDFTERVESDKATVSQCKNGKIKIPNDLFVKISKAFPNVDIQSPQ